jgi:hypothetical protein
MNQPLYIGPSLCIIHWPLIIHLVPLFINYTSPPHYTSALNYTWALIIHPPLWYPSALHYTWFLYIGPHYTSGYSLYIGSVSIRPSLYIGRIHPHYTWFLYIGPSLYIPSVSIRPSLYIGRIHPHYTWFLYIGPSLYIPLVFIIHWPSLYIRVFIIHWFGIHLPFIIHWPYSSALYMVLIHWPLIIHPFGIHYTLALIIHPGIHYTLAPRYTSTPSVFIIHWFIHPPFIIHGSYTLALIIHDAAPSVLIRPSLYIGSLYPFSIHYTLYIPLRYSSALYIGPPNCTSAHIIHPHRHYTLALVHWICGYCTLHCPRHI